MNFGINNNEEGGKYIRACQAQEVRFLSVGTEIINDNNTLQVKMCLIGEEENKVESKFNFWFMSDKNAEITNKQLMSWLNRTCSQEYLDANIIGKQFADLEAYAAALNKALAGKTIRILFGGREYVNKEGEVATSAKLIAFDSSEAIVDGVVKPKVAAEDSKLVFNPMDKYHMERLAVAPPTGETSMVTNAVAEGEDDLPF